MATVGHLLPGSADSAADLSSREVQQRLSKSAIAAFFRLAQAWGLRDEASRHLLGGVSNGMFYELKRGGRKTLDQDKLTRISAADRDPQSAEHPVQRTLADAWVTRPNSIPMFAGEAPVAFMIRGGVPALMRVRQLLDARRGGR